MTVLIKEVNMNYIKSKIVFEYVFQTKPTYFFSPSQMQDQDLEMEVRFVFLYIWRLTRGCYLRMFTYAFTIIDIWDKFTVCILGKRQMKKYHSTY